ncbi:hypothetical protein ACIHFC_13965 [Streptomyces sp. NPDC052013]|uniref:hypothetical protein n=1 Tax=unclassified Streptomyces TaxID=2593676 RepID=UPI00344BA367
MIRLLLLSAGGEMKVEMVQQAASVLFDVPDEVHEEIITLIGAVAGDRETQASDLAAAFGDWCWLVYTRHGDVIEVLDVGCAR